MCFNHPDISFQTKMFGPGVEFKPTYIKKKKKKCTIEDDGCTIFLSSNISLINYIK